MAYSALMLLVPRAVRLVFQRMEFAAYVHREHAVIVPESGSAQEDPDEKSKRALDGAF